MRQFIRHPSDVPIVYDLGTVVAHEKEYLTNISQGGLCFRSRVSIPPHSAIHIQIPIRNPVFQANGVVVWCRPSNGHYDVGVAFDNPSTEFGVRMVEQVCHIEQYKKDILETEGRVLSGEDAALEWIEKFGAGFPR